MSIFTAAVPLFHETEDGIQRTRHAWKIINPNDPMFLENLQTFVSVHPNFPKKKHHNPPIPHPTPNFPHGTFKFSATNSRFNGSSLAANPATVGFPLSASPAKRKAAGEFWMATVARVGLDLGQIWKIFYNIGKLMGFNFDDVNVCLMVFCEFLWKFHGFSQILLGFHRLTLIRV